MFNLLQISQCIVIMNHSVSVMLSTYPEIHNCNFLDVFVLSRTECYNFSHYADKNFSRK